MQLTSVLFSSRLTSLVNTRFLTVRECESDSLIFIILAIKSCLLHAVSRLSCFRKWLLSFDSYQQRRRSRPGITPE